MVKLHILGTGCPKCHKLADLVQDAAEELGIEYDLEKVADIDEIMSYNVMITPALVVDGEVRVAGKVPSLEEIKDLLRPFAR
jgi:small redox-active disulfide protein 2